ncbi:MAG: aminotransferase class III-fold pyridoxal phosphate-dependent enzyme [Alphaproteobacteria bacterium]|nr:aminotransferase class III-fold pyridoxal phosphate-dependent enzyme [Alphaproteobacteria bacterium]
MSSVLNCTGHEVKLPNIVDSDGANLFDDRGNRYLDLESGVWCMSVGHNNARVNAAIVRQIDSIAHTGFCYSSNVVETASRSVLAIAGLDGGQCVFLSSGSEVIELARQVCRDITKKSTTICLHDAYFGSYSATNDRVDGWYEFDWRECAACPHSENCRKDCHKLKDIPDDISEFAFEPGSASGFVRFPPVSLITNIVEIVRNRGGKIIVNEITTGMGRTGEWFGYNHYRIKPDLLCIGKGLGNGYPVSALAINQNVARELEHGTFKYMQSHQNDPLGAAVVCEVIAIMQDENLISRAASVGKEFLTALQTLADSEHISEVRGRGLMYAVEFTDKEVGDRIYEDLLQRGYIVCNRGGMFRIDPPLTTKEADFSGFVEVFKELLAAELM